MKTVLVSIFSLFLSLTFLLGPPPFMVTPISVDDFTKEDKKKYNTADLLFQKESYSEALPIYLELVDKFPEDLFFRYRAGICYLYKGDEREKALEFLEEVYTRAPEFTESKFYLGRAYHLNYKFDEAIKVLKEFEEDGAMNREERELAERYMFFSRNGKKIMAEVSETSIEELKGGINTKGDEYVPLVSTDEKEIIFTYRGEFSIGGKQNDKGKSDEVSGHYYEDVFVSYNDNGSWSRPISIADNINTDKHEAALSVSLDRQRLFVYKNDEQHEADIMMAKFDGEEWTRPKKLKGDVNSKHWEGSACISSDGRTLYFASNRPGGYGGRDIYKASLLPDGNWGNVENLGPKINTAFNEDAPFIHPDNGVLYFSSDGHLTMGGYDIFYSYRQDNGEFAFPENMGYPVSTTDDDRYYMVSVDGKTGYFSSQMQGGKGGHDIYKILPGSAEEMPKLILVKGKVLLDGQPTYAEIKLQDAESGEPAGYFETNAITGELSMVLIKKSNLRIKIEAESADPYVEYIKVEDLENYVKVEHVFRLYTPEYKELVGVDESTNPQLTDVVKEELKNQNSKHEQAYATVLNLYGEKKVDNVKYIIEIPPNEKVDFDALKTAGYPIKQSAFKKGYYTMEGGDTFAKAEKLRKSLANKYPDLKHSKVMVMDNGHRKDVELFYAKEFDEALQQEVIAAAKEYEENKDFVESKIDESELGLNENDVDKELIRPEDIKLTADCSSDFIDFSEFVGADLNNKEIYNKFIEVGGNYCAEGLEFEVQIGAYRFPNNFKYPHLRKFGSAEVRDYPDDITRFTMGVFPTLKEAEKLRQRIIKAGQFDAWITPFYKGKRHLMHELIEVNFYGAKVN